MNKLDSYIAHAKSYGTDGVLDAAALDGLDAANLRTLAARTGARIELPAEIHAEDSARFVERHGSEDRVSEARELVTAYRALIAAAADEPRARTAANLAERSAITRKLRAVAQQAAQCLYAPDPSVDAARLLEAEAGISIEHLQTARRNPSKRSARKALVRALKIISGNRLATREALGAALGCSAARVSQLVNA